MFITCQHKIQSGTEVRNAPTNLCRHVSKKKLQTSEKPGKNKQGNMNINPLIYLSKKYINIHLILCLNKN